MTTASYRLKLTRVNSLKLKVATRIPAELVATSPIILTRAGGVYTFSFDVASLGGVLIVNADNITLGSQTGTGAMVRATSPTLVTPALGTPSAIVLTNATGTAAGLTAGNVTTNANLTGDVTSVGNATTLATVNANVGTFGSATQVAQLTANAKGQLTAVTNVTVTPAVGSVTGMGTGVATFLATPTSANLRAALTDEVGTGVAYFVNGALGTPASGTATNLTGLPLSGLATQGAFTFVGNNTSGTAVPTAVDIAALTTKASPAAGDFAIISDQAASGAWKKATVSSLSSASGVSSVNGQTGALVSYFPPQGRLTLQTVTPVMTTTQSAKTTIFYTPYQGNMVPIYDGTNMVPTAVSEISVATTDTAKSPAAIGASKVNDWFVWNDTGTIRIGHGPDWTNDTTRSAGTALVMVNGILLNNASITNGPAASRGTYVGTTRSNASSQLDYIFGASASGGTAAFFGVWNAYNRKSTATTVTDNGVGYTYTTNTIRQARASAGNQISFVVGLAEDGLSAHYTQRVDTTATVSAGGRTGIGLDMTAGFSNPRNLFAAPTANVLTYTVPSPAILFPAIGFHFISANESGDGVNANTFDADQNAQLSAIIKN